ncbi:MAG: histidine kinase dimerization/phospho-acceptor domain-containing protein, partial [Anaerolineales bacterium]
LAGLFSGVLSSIWGTHSPFTWLETVGLALLISVAVRQRYRTTFYRILRHPLAAGILLSVVYAPVYILTAFFAVNGTVAVRLDYALTQTWVVMILRGVELVIACSIAELLYLTRVPYWGRVEPLKPSPAETNLQQRFFYNTAPLVFGLILALTVSDWIVAGNAARRMISNRLSSTAQVAANSLPYFLEAGQSLIVSQATPDLLDLPPEAARERLAERLRAVPYFQQLYLFGADSQLIASFPDFRQFPVRMTEEEDKGISLALKGIPVQTYTIRPIASTSAAWMTFLALIRDDQNIPVGVLVGRTDLSSNPFTQPAIKALETAREMGGEGFLLDEKGRILYHPISSLVMTNYIGNIPQSKPALYDEISPTGTRRLVYYYPVTGRTWAVILSVPAEQSQQLALEIAVPLLGLLLLVSLVAYLILRLGLKTITSSLTTLAHEATLIAQGHLDHPLAVKGEDEVAQFSRAFEKMRLGLKARLEELNQLLIVSQGVAANLEVENAVRSVLQAALGQNGSAARLVLIREVTMEAEGEPFVSYGYGPSEKVYSYLDGQIFDLMRQQNVLLLSNTKRTRRLTFKAGIPEPGAVLALALHHESQYYGALWVAHDHPYSFTTEEVRFMETLAGQAALAAANARLYVSAEVGRQRLEAVLSSTPEPVMVIDEWWRLLLMNPAANQVPGLVTSAVQQGRPIQEVIAHPDLLRLIIASTGTVNTGEITAGGRIYFVNVSPVVANERMFGKICILQDITHFKELDSIKSDFVSTVSHDLRSPLTLVRGYVSMLQMVGQLNDQQQAYVQKIFSGIENMRRLVDNLLDLGRI